MEGEKIKKERELGEWKKKEYLRQLKTLFDKYFNNIDES